MENRNVVVNAGRDGFSLLEVTIAMGVLTGALVTLGQMFAVSISNHRAAQTLTYTAALAAQKMEELRGLSWGFDNAGAAVSDTSTDTAVAVGTPGGGTGLSPSPADTLIQNTDGWVDYVDRFGSGLGGGAIAPRKTVYIRRWAIEPLRSNPDNTIAIHVLVTSRTNRGAADARGSTVRLPGETHLVTVKTRKAQ